jgi:hypothetical protein
MGELGLKDHQLVLKDQELESQDSWPKKLEAQLVGVHKGRMHEANGMHASIRLLMDNERECRQLCRRCRFWRSRALAKPNPSGGTS